MREGPEAEEPGYLDSVSSHRSEQDLGPAGYRHLLHDVQEALGYAQTRARESEETLLRYDSMVVDCVMRASAGVTESRSAVARTRDQVQRLEAAKARMLNRNAGRSVRSARTVVLKHYPRRDLRPVRAQRRALSPDHVRTSLSPEPDDDYVRVSRILMSMGTAAGVPSITDHSDHSPVASPAGFLSPEPTQEPSAFQLASPREPACQDDSADAPLSSLGDIGDGDDGGDDDGGDDDNDDCDDDGIEILSDTSPTSSWQRLSRMSIRPRVDGDGVGDGNDFATRKDQALRSLPAPGAHTPLSLQQLEQHLAAARRALNYWEDEFTRRSQLISDLENMVSPILQWRTVSASPALSASSSSLVSSASANLSGAGAGPSSSVRPAATSATASSAAVSAATSATSTTQQFLTCCSTSDAAFTQTAEPGSVFDALRDAHAAQLAARRAEQRAIAAEAQRDALATLLGDAGRHLHRQRAILAVNGIRVPSAQQRALDDVLRQVYRHATFRSRDPAASRAASPTPASSAKLSDGIAASFLRWLAPLMLRRTPNADSGVADTTNVDAIKRSADASASTSSPSVAAASASLPASPPPSSSSSPPPSSPSPSTALVLHRSGQPGDMSSGEGLTATLQLVRKRIETGIVEASISAAFVLHAVVALPATLVSWIFDDAEPRHSSSSCSSSSSSTIRSRSRSRTRMTSLLPASPSWPSSTTRSLVNAHHHHHFHHHYHDGVRPGSSGRIDAFWDL